MCSGPPGAIQVLDYGIELSKATKGLEGGLANIPRFTRPKEAH